MTNDWMARAKRFQNILLEQTEDRYLPFFHSMMLINGDPGKGFDDPRPKTYGPGEHAIWRIEVPLQSNWRCFHYFLAAFSTTDGDEFDKFLKVVHLIPGVLQGLPSAVPKFLNPQMPEGPDKHLARWFQLVSWLGSRRSTYAFRTHLQCLGSLSDLNWSSISNYNDRTYLDEWAYGPQSAEYSPYEKLTVAKHQAKSKLRKPLVTQGIPEVMAANLDSNILYCSINALNVLMQMASRRSGSQQEPAHENGSVFKIQSFLKSYHLASDEERRRINAKIGKESDLPWLTQKEIAKGAGVSQPTVARRMKGGIPRLPGERLQGRRLYQELCNSGAIRKRMQMMKDPVAMLDQAYQEAKDELPEAMLIISKRRTDEEAVQGLEHFSSC